jgi:hypothetical protein
MAAPDDPALAPLPGPATVPVTIRSAVPALQDGTLVLARVDAPALGIDCAYLFLDPRANAMGLLSPCGCHVEVALSGLLRELQATLAHEHGDGPCRATH